METKTRKQIEQAIHNIIKTANSDTYATILLTSKNKTNEKTMLDEIIDDLTRKKKTTTYTEIEIKESIGRILSKRIGIK